MIAFISFCRRWKITDDFRNKYFTNTRFKVIERYMNKMDFVTEFCRKKQHSRKIFHECHIFFSWRITLSVFDRRVLLREGPSWFNLFASVFVLLYVFRNCKINWPRKEKLTNLTRAIEIFSLLNKAFKSIEHRLEIMAICSRNIDIKNVDYALNENILIKNLDV